MRVFDGSLSGTNADCRPLVSFEWDFGDDEKGSGEIGRHTFSRPGAYRVQLTVTDACRGVATDVVDVEIDDR
jgi:PKD repeat protein